MGYDNVMSSFPEELAAGEHILCNAYAKAWKGSMASNYFCFSFPELIIFKRSPRMHKTKL